MVESGDAHGESNPAASNERPIGDHGLIGDGATAALVAHDGAIDFLCWPHFDSPTIFASLLDPDCGAFTLAPDFADARRSQSYLPDTNILLTRWLTLDRSAEVLDVIVPRDGPEGGPPRLLRRLRATRGTVTFRLCCRPRPDYGRERPAARMDGRCVLFETETLGGLRLTGPALAAGEAEATAEITLEAGQSACFLLGTAEGHPPDDTALDAMIDRATVFWRQWSHKCRYKGRWREQVMRSALALKLMISRKHHSIIAAPTFGLPEQIGGNRNWDYRAVWIRDASFTVYAFLRLGYVEEASDFMGWVEGRVADSDWDGHVQVMYRVDGEREFPEITLDHMAGYRGSRPVRIGNEAIGQVQLDVYGELMDSLYLKNKYGRGIAYESWKRIQRMIAHVVEHWRDPDNGIWEIRDTPRHYLHSRLMCWVAVDRALRLADKRSLAAPFAEWTAVRNEIYESINTEFWDAERGYFVQSLETRELDAAVLLMPLMRFIGATDPRWLATLDAIGRELTDGGLVWRYRGEDGLPRGEASFTACSFWYVECLARAGRLEAARENFERILGYANHLGLFAEELDARGVSRGNFPQGLTHLGLISAAHYLDRELDDGRMDVWRA